MHTRERETVAEEAGVSGVVPATWTPLSIEPKLGDERVDAYWKDAQKHQELDRHLADSARAQAK